jgi:hypothetical protein
MGSIAAEWVKKYHGNSSNLRKTEKQAEGFYNTLYGVKDFIWGNDDAWDIDFEEQGTGSPSTGQDSGWIDSVDIAFFSGHGNSSGACFGRLNQDSGKAVYSEMRLGNKRLKWIAFDACQVLKYEAINNWHPVFKGLRYILGFHTNSKDESKRGRYLAEYLNDGYLVRNAWRKACKETEKSSHKYAYLLAIGQGSDTWNDKWNPMTSKPAPFPVEEFCYINEDC